MGLWSKKSVEHLQSEASLEGEHSLKRSLGALNLTLLGIGAIIGAGIFVLTGTAAAQYAGPAIVISFIIAGFGCLFAGLCYAEFASMIPIAGSAYTYGYATLGEFIAWIIGWDLILEYLFAASTVAVGWSGYFTEFLGQIGIHIPRQFTSAPFGVEGTHTLVRSVLCVDPANNALITAGTCDLTKYSQFHGFLNIPAMALVAILTVLLVVGIQESARFNNAVVIVKIAIVLLVIGFGFMYVNSANWHPFIPANTGTFGSYGWSGILRGAGVIFFAYIGFDAVSTSAQEARDPQRDMPRGILGSLAICTVLFVLVSAVMVGVVPYKQMLNQPAPLVIAIEAAAGRAAGTPWGPLMNGLTILLTLGAVAALSSVMVVMMLAQPRIFLAMSKDGLMPKWAGAVHPRFKTPHISTIVTGVVVAIAAGLTPIATLGTLVSIGTLMAFVIVSIGVIVLRRTRPDLPRPFRMPLVPLLPALSAVVSFVLMLSLPWSTWERLILWMAIGVAVYFGYGYR